MIKRLLKNQLPLLVTIQTASDRIQKVDISWHPEGFCYRIIGNSSETLQQQIESFLVNYAKKKSAPLPSFDWNKTHGFTHQVLSYLPTILIGNTSTYGQVAQMIGSPRAARAVGNACGRNPFLLFIPCHRVLASQGIGGFNAGIGLKKRLLDFESTRGLCHV